MSLTCTAFGPIIPVSIVMMDCIWAYSYFSNALCTVGGGGSYLSCLLLNVCLFHLRWVNDMGHHHTDLPVLRWTAKPRFHLWTSWLLIAVCRRSTRWPIPSYFLFPSSSIPSTPLSSLQCGRSSLRCPVDSVWQICRFGLFPSRHPRREG